MSHFRKVRSFHATNPASQPRQLVTTKPLAEDVSSRSLMSCGNFNSSNTIDSLQVKFGRTFSPPCPVLSWMMEIDELRSKRANYRYWTCDYLLHSSRCPLWLVNSYTSNRSETLFISGLSWRMRCRFWDVISSDFCRLFKELKAGFLKTLPTDLESPTRRYFHEQYS